MIVLKKNGDVIISGNNISIKGSGQIDVKAAGNMVLKANRLITD
jgi:type VI secretion system secreted protein VgrG